MSDSQYFPECLPDYDTAALKKARGLKEPSTNKKPEEYCRVCASGGRLFSVYQAENGRLVDLLSKHLDLSIKKTDGLSSKICSDCIERIIAFHDYFEMCIKVQDMIIKWKLKESSIDVIVGTLNIDKTNYTNVKNEIKCERTLNEPSSEVLGDNSKHTVNSEIISEESNVAYQCIDDNNLHNSDSEDDIALSSLKKKSTKKKQRDTPYKYGVMCKNISFQCHVCKMEFRSWHILANHTQKKHRTYAFAKCTACNVELKSRTSLYSHVKNHKDPSALSCDKCPVICKTTEALEKHKLRHIPKTERGLMFKCNRCPKVFRTRQNLKSHEMSHVPLEEKRKFPCPMCDLKFTSSNSVNMHLKNVHYKIKRCMCDLCGYVCCTQHELKNHRAIHSTERPFVCSVCSKSFKTDSNLKVHMSTHSNVTYTCEICSRVLTSRKTYLRHKRYVHTDQRKHVCSYCSISFKRKETLRAHMNSHTGVKPIQCKWCKERFMYWGGYRTHKLRHHPEVMTNEKRQNKTENIDSQIRTTDKRFNNFVNI